MLPSLYQRLSLNTTLITTYRWKRTALHKLAGSRSWLAWNVWFHLYVFLDRLNNADEAVREWWNYILFRLLIGREDA